MKVAILGYGTVGSGVYEVLTKNAQLIEKRAGERIEVKYVLDLREFPGDPVENVLVHDYSIIASDPEIGVVVEVMGGTEPAYTFVKEALLKGKSVCTSNKELVAKYGAELIEIAKQKKINFLFEASVGGGIPVIRPLISSITCDEVEEVSGILNGTTNYILTKMSSENLDFEDVLKDAQAKGFAERNPSADIDGFDAARKLAILASLSYGKQVDFEDIYTEGITDIDKRDMLYAKALGMKIKLVASAKKTDGGISAMVTPKLVDEANPLYNVDDVFNAVLVHGNFLGDVMFYGKGAGKLPTASAVASDVVDAVKHNGKHVIIYWNPKKLELEKKACVYSKFFVRVPKADRDMAAKLFRIEKAAEAEIEDEFAFITAPMSEGDFDAKASEIKVIGRIRA
jgi:homoserine dehydrogenase